MKFRSKPVMCFGLLLVPMLASCATTAKHSTPVYSQRTFTYPQPRRSDHVDVLHGVTVADPYRWMEDPDAPETRAWIDAENAVTMPYLESLPARQKIKDRLTKLWDYEKYSTPFSKNGRYFYSKNDGLQNQYVLYTATSLDAKPTVLLDPNKWSADGTVALSGMSVSEDGNLVAYATSTAGSDWQEWKVKDIRTGQELPDHIKWAKFTGASWLPDGSGFFYSRYDEPNEATKLEDVNYFQKLCFHKLGTPQSADVLVYDRPDQKDWGFGGGVTEDGQYLIISVWQGTDERNRVFYRDLSKSPSLSGSVNGGMTAAERYPEVVELIPELEAEYGFVGNDGPVFWFKTDLDAPLGRVLAIDIRSPAKSNWKEVIPQSKDALKGVGVVGERMICQYLHDAHSKVHMHDLNGKFLREVKLPGLGSAGGFGGLRKDKETFYSYESFITPPSIFRYDLANDKVELFRKPDIDFNFDRYEAKQVFYTSKDGTRIPMFIAHKKGLKLDGNNPTELYGYGGFNASLTPSFAVTRMMWMEMGGVFAMANLRGGGEYGKDWHEGGMKLAKQNVFDDFIAAGEWLIANKYTSPKKLAISGGSNGGLLVGACITQRPDLFAAALPAVGVMDMLRFHKFTIGWAWTSDYGSPDNPDEFKALYAYSPYHNLKPGVRYPSTLVTTADHDDRVVPAHSFKFAAALQNSHKGENPVLIRIETKAGHGAGKPTTKRIEEAADKMAFLVDTLGMKVN